MDRIEACDGKVRELFGAPANVGEGNDPEIMQILQRFIFGELSYVGTLDDRMRELVTCVVLATYQTLPQLKAHANAALNVGVTPLELREAIYGCMPLIGCPKTLNAVATIDEVFAARGVELPLEGASTVGEAERAERGAAIMRTIYGPAVDGVAEGLPDDFAEVLPRLIAEYRFGDFYTRRGLDTKTRTLLDLVVATALGAGVKQVAGHAQGCLAAGNTVGDVYTALVHAMAYTGVPRAMAAISAVKETI